MRARGLTDGSAGMVAQVRALADAMGIELSLQTVKVNPIWRYLPNKAFDFKLHKLFPICAEPVTDIPELVISCGRKGALVNASLDTKAKRIHIQDPQMSPSHFEVVIAMAHDKLAASNVISVPLALHSISEQKLVTARRQWEPKFAHLPKPWNAVLIGGSTNRYKLTPEAMHELLEQMKKIEGSLLITNSRRTGEVGTQLLLNYFGHSKNVFLYTGEIENPYMGMLACADHIYVTNDSVNMMSEALATGKPVTILPLKGHAKTKPARFARDIANNRQNPQNMMIDLAGTVRQMLA